GNADERFNLMSELRRGVAHSDSSTKCQFDTHRQRIEVPGATHLEYVMRREGGYPNNQLLDLGRKEIDTPNDQHVIRPADNAAHAPHGTRPSQITGPSFGSAHSLATPGPIT